MLARTTVKVIYVNLTLLVMTLMVVTQADAASPDLSTISPPGVQRGTEAVLKFNGNRLKDAQEVMFYDKGVEVVELKAENDKVVSVKVKVAEDAPIGMQRVRMRTVTGITEVKVFYVGPFPSVSEVDNKDKNNNSFNEPQEVPFNSTVQGVVENEDVDYFVVNAKKGQRITAEVEGMRLATTFFDPYVAILNDKRFELAVSDDSSLALQDPVASTIAPEDGKYIVMVRESAYGGSGSSRYRLHIGSQPRPLVVYPAGGQIGQSIDFKLIGDPKGVIGKHVKLPDEANGEFPIIAEHEGLVAAAPNIIRVSDYPNQLEVEPNDNFSQVKAATQTLPVALNGIIEKDGDIDCFRVNAKKGQDFHVRCVARGVRSPLDPVLNIYDGKGKRLTGNDDSGGPDSYVRWKVPADGEYIFRVSDHLGKGGEDYVFRIEFEQVKPELVLEIPLMDRNNPQTGHNITVHRGNLMGRVIRTNRQNFGGDLKILAESLPDGVRLHAPVVKSNVSEVPVILEAAPDAPLSGKLIDLTGEHVDPKTKIHGRYSQGVVLVQGNPNRTEYMRTTVDRLAVAVGEEAEYKVRIEESPVPIVRNGTMSLKVVIDRKEGFKSRVRVRMLTKPPGIGCSSYIDIPEGKSEGYYPLNANGGAAIGDWEIAVVGEASGKYGTEYVASPLTKINIGQPFLDAKLDMAAAERGKSVEVVCNLDIKEAFEGEAEITLHGLPARTKVVGPKKINKDTKEVVFTVETEGNAPTGQHKNLFCHVKVPKNKAIVYHNIGQGGVLRIDPPPPPKKTAEKPKPKPKAQPKEAPKKKRLSRLEQLRLQQQEDK